MPAKPFRTKRKRASAERYLRPLGATIDIAPPHVKASNGFRERDIVAWRFTKRQSGYQGEYWVLSLSGNCCAHTHIPAHRRDQLECLIRYTARGAVSLERLEQDANGDLVSTFTHPWSDGTTEIRLAPLELLEKLAALVPLPHVHLVRYGG